MISIKEMEKFMEDDDFFKKDKKADLFFEETHMDKLSNKLWIGFEILLIVFGLMTTFLGFQFNSGDNVTTSELQQILNNVDEWSGGILSEACSTFLIAGGIAIIVVAIIIHFVRKAARKDFFGK